MDKPTGDNIAFTFGLDRNVETFVARTINGLTAIETTFADAEWRRLTGLYGNPQEGPLDVKGATFDQVCEDLIGHGWWLQDWNNFTPVWATDVWTGTNRFYKVRMTNTFTWHEASHTVTLEGDRVFPWIQDMERSGLWTLLAVVNL